VKKLMSQNGVVLDISFKDKSRLKRGNNLREKDFLSICYDFGDNFVYDFAKANRSKLVSRMRTT
jgi:hypothetical protein